MQGVSGNEREVARHIILPLKQFQLLPPPLPPASCQAAHKDPVWPYPAIDWWTGHSGGAPSVLAPLPTLTTPSFSLTSVGVGGLVILWGLAFAVARDFLLTVSFACLGVT